MLSWFDHNPEAAWWLACAALVTVVFLAVRPAGRPDWSTEEPGSDWRWGFAIFLVLLAGRWPTFFVTREFNGDESQLIAGVITLRHDPMFWRSVDGGTAGPLDFYALLPVGWLTGGDSYFSARLTALLLIGGALLFTHQTLVLWFGRTVARIAGLGALALEALILHPDFRHYSTELVPIFILALAIWVAARWQAASQRSIGLGVTLGAVLGCVPLAKLQGSPIAAAIGFGALVAVVLHPDLTAWSAKRKRLAALVVGALLPVAVAALFLVATGETENAVTPYLRHNLIYVQAAYFGIKEWSSTMVIALGSPGMILVWWLAGTAGAVALLCAGVFKAPRRLQVLATLGLTLVVISALCVLAPRRPFTHYFQFLVMPITLLLGTTLALACRPGSTSRQRLGAVMLCVVATLFGPIARRAAAVDPHVGQLVAYQTHPVGPIAQMILEYAHPDDALGLWGWPCFPYGETHLRQATRDAHSQAEIIAHPFYDYFRRRYLQDFTKNLPAVFVDVSRLPGYAFSEVGIDHDRIFPEFAAIIRQNYTLAGTIDGARIFVRNDRWQEVNKRPTARLTVTGSGRYRAAIRLRRRASAIPNGDSIRPLLSWAPCPAKADIGGNNRSDLMSAAREGN